MSYKFLAVLTLVFLTGSQPAHALSCAQVPGMEDAIPQNELIVRARVAAVAAAFHVPLIQDADDVDQILTFQILDIYKAPQNMPVTFEARFSNFFDKWGPNLKVGDEGEYLFDKNEGEWVFKGPGGCFYPSEKAWEELRKNKRQP